MPKPQLTTLRLEQIAESPLNPRKHYDPAAMGELVASIQESGIIDPVLVRPLGDERFELATGHRRCRAAKQAGLGEVPAIIRDLDDKTFIEILNVSNLQRDDLHPLEEAEGFKTLLEKVGYDIAAIAKRVGHTANYVYDRLRLLKLTPAAKKLFVAGKFEIGHAVILARLSPSDQERALGGHEERVRYGRVGGVFLPELGLFHDEDAEEDDLKPVSVKELQAWVDRNVRFDPKQDETAEFLFPETVDLVGAAELDKTKIVHVTHEYRVPDEARDPKVRTFGEQHWKRADGKQGSKECPHAVVGLVVAGPHRGDAFRVCVRKDKCKVHWAKEQKELEAARRARAREDGPAPKRKGSSSQEEQGQTTRRELQNKARAFDEQRVAAARPAIIGELQLLAKKMPVDAASSVGKVILAAVMERAGIYGERAKAARAVPPGRTAEDLVRHLAFILLLAALDDDYLANDLKGIDVAAIIAKHAKPLTCVHCGCTHAKACKGGCEWISLEPPVCSAKGCAKKHAAAAPAAEKPAKAKAKGEIAVKKVGKTLREQRAAKKAKKATP